MSDALSIAATPNSDTARTAIARAAQATGVDFGYLLAQAQLESSMDPSAHAARSSAAGLFQFTNGTWANTLARHGADHGLYWAQAALSGGAAGRTQAMALRYDPSASAMMAAELARDNGAELTAKLGRAPDGPELYLAHFLGIGGAKRFLSALADNPGTSAASLLPEAAAANPSTFYAADGTPRSVAQTMQLLRTRMAAATDTAANGVSDTGALGSNAVMAAASGDGFPIDPLPSVPASMAAAQLPPAPGAPQMAAVPRLSEILDTAFGAGGGVGGAGGNAPAFVRTAYAKLQAFGL